MEASTQVSGEVTTLKWIKRTGSELMADSEIVKRNLETRIAEMKKEGLSESNIAETLSKETNQKITKSSVHRYLSANVKLCQQAVAINDKMKVKVLEAELDTIDARHELIRKIRELGDKAEECGDLKTALYALDKAVNALDSLDKRLGKFTDKPEIQVSIQMFSELKSVIIGELCPECKTKIKGKLHEIISN